MYKAPANKPRLLQGDLNFEKWEYYDNQYYIKYLLLNTETHTQGFIYKIFKRKTNSYLMQITIDFGHELAPTTQKFPGPVVTGITVFPDLKYIFTSTGQNISFFINLELLSIAPLGDGGRNSYSLIKTTKNFKYCIVGITSYAGELLPSIGSVAIYEILSGSFCQIAILNGQFFEYEYSFVKMSSDDKKIVVRKSPHSSINAAPEGSRINTKYSYSETYSIPDLSLLNSQRVENQ